jgi:hypothetical protein
LSIIEAGVGEGGIGGGIGGSIGGGIGGSIGGGIGGSIGRGIGWKESFISLLKYSYGPGPFNGNFHEVGINLLCN